VASSQPKFRINFDKIDKALRKEIMDKMGISNLSHLGLNETQPTKAEDYEYYDEEEPPIEEKVDLKLKEISSEKPIGLVE
jgi:hypothetical protein